MNILSGLKHPLVRGGGILAVSQYIAAGLSLITTIIVARVLGSENYGLFSLVIAYPTLLLSFGSIKSSSVTTRYIAGYRASGEKENLLSVAKLGYSLDLVISLLVLVIACATATWVSAHFYCRPSLTLLIIGFAASFPLYSFSGTSEAILVSFESYRWLAILRVLDPVVRLALVGLSLVLGFGVAGVVVATALTHAINGLLMLVVATSALKCQGFGFWWLATLGRLTHMQGELFGLFKWNYLLVTLSGIVSQFPVMILGRFRGPVEAGYYNIASSIVTVGSYLESSLSKVAYPTLSARRAVGGMRSKGASLLRWTWSLGLPVSILLLISIPLFPFIIPWLIGTSYKPMIWGAQVMMLSAVVSALFFWVAPSYFAEGLIARFTKCYIFFSCFIVSLGWFAAQQWGFFGMALITLIGKGFFTGVMTGDVLVPKRTS